MHQAHGSPCSVHSLNFSIYKVLMDLLLLHTYSHFHSISQLLFTFTWGLCSLLILEHVRINWIVLISVRWYMMMKLTYYRLGRCWVSSSSVVTKASLAAWQKRLRSKCLLGLLFVGSFFINKDFVPQLQLRPCIQKSCLSAQITSILLLTLFCQLFSENPENTILMSHI